MKNVEVNNRPRERLIELGVNNLSDDELLAIILKTGTRGKGVKDLASEVIFKVGGVNNFKNLEPEHLYDIKGIGKVKSTYILAAIEFGKRVYMSDNTIKNKVFNNADMIHKYFKDEIGSSQQECFYCLYLDINKRIIKIKKLFVGSVSSSMVHPREIFKEAYLLSASAIVCVHNHPSGNIVPSKNDIETTELLVSIGNLMGIKVVDHIIVSNKEYFSFFEENII